MKLSVLVLFPITVFCQIITCEYETLLETKIIQFTQDVLQEIPSLPYHITCRDKSTLLLNTSYIKQGSRSTLHMKYPRSEARYTQTESEEDSEVQIESTNFPFHLTYTHFNPQIMSKRYPIRHQPVILESIVEKEKVEDQGFLRKYWMYIIPFLIITFVTSGAGEEEEVKVGAPVVAAKK